jgi:hypothetical protein
MGLIAVFCNLLLGYREHKTNLLILLVVPIVSSIAFFLIADIDSPSGGRHPRNSAELDGGISVDASPVEIGRRPGPPSAHEITEDGPVLRGRS